MEKISFPIIKKKKRSRKAKSASGNELKITGKIDCTFAFHGKTIKIVAHVTKENELNHFSSNWLENFSLWDSSIKSICNLVK